MAQIESAYRRSGTCAFIMCQISFFPLNKIQWIQLHYKRIFVCILFISCIYKNNQRSVQNIISARSIHGIVTKKSEERWRALLVSQVAFGAVTDVP